MNARSFDERLSAYLDGELSPRERDEVRRLLDESPEVQGDLDELTALSETLQSLPRESAPEETASAVLKRIERESLLRANPSPTAEAQVRRPRPAGSADAAERPGPRSWIMAIGSVAATVAAVVILLRLPPPATVERSETAPSGSAVAQRDSAMPGLSDEAADSRVSPAENGAADELSAIGRKQEAVPPTSDQSRSMAAAEGVSPKVDWSDVEIGEVVPYFQTEGDRVAVVEVTVVDIHRGLGAMRVLLARNSVPQMDTADPAEGGGSAETDRQNNRPLALYVETSEQQLTSTLAELRKDSSFVDLRLQPPVAADQLAMLEKESSAHEDLSVEAPGAQARSVAAPPSPRGRTGEGQGAAGTRVAAVPEPPPTADAAPEGAAAAEPSRSGETPVAQNRRPAVAPELPADSRRFVTRRELETGRQRRGRRQGRTPAARSFQKLVDLRDPSVAKRVLVRSPGSAPGQRGASAAVDDVRVEPGGEFKQAERTGPVRVVFVFREAQGAGAPGNQEQ